MKTNRKTLSKFTKGMMVTTCLCMGAIPDIHAGELLKKALDKQDNFLLLGNTHARGEILNKVIKNYDELNEKLRDALDTLWSDAAGKLLLRSLCKEIKLDSQRIKILWNACDENNETNLFCYDNSTIYLMESRFGQYVGYCNGKFSQLPETLDAVLFHELCHGLHALKHSKQYEQHKTISALYNISQNDPICKSMNQAWTDDEEIYTISGWHMNANNELDFDYLNTNSYIALQALDGGRTPENVVQRLFHCSYGSWKTKYDRLFKKVTINLEKFLINLEKSFDS